jgi:hypothetical protein
VATTTSRSEPRLAANARRASGAAAFAALLALGACRERTPPPVASSVQPLPIAPADLVLTGELGQPQAFYEALGGLVPPALVAKPSSRWEPAAVALMDLPREVGERLDPAGPVLLLGLGSNAEIRPVFAARVQSGEEIVALLTQGTAAPRRAERRHDGVVLLPRASGSASGPALAVVDRFVVSSPDAGALERAAAYAVRGVSPDRPRAMGVRFSAHQAALAASLRTVLAERWSATRAELERSAEALRRERGRAADFAEPSGVLALLDRLMRGVGELLASSVLLAVALVPHDDRLELTLELEPDRAGAAAELMRSLRPAGLSPFGGLPGESAAALIWRPTAEGPSDTNAGEPLRALFGPRLSAPDAERVSAFVTALSRDPPPARAFSLLGDRTVVYREERLKDLPGTDLETAVALLELPAFSAPLAALLRQPVVERAETPLEATLAVGPSARTVVAGASAAPKRAGLELSPALRARHEPAAFALHVELSRLGLSATNAPAFLSLTRASRAITLRFELSRGASHALLERILSR